VLLLINNSIRRVTMLLSEGVKRAVDGLRRVADGKLKHARALEESAEGLPDLDLGGAVAVTVWQSYSGQIPYVSIRLNKGEMLDPVSRTLVMRVMDYVGVAGLQWKLESTGRHVYLYLMDHGQKRAIFCIQQDHDRNCKRALVVSEVDYCGDDPVGMVREIGDGQGRDDYRVVAFRQ